MNKTELEKAQKKIDKETLYRMLVNTTLEKYGMFLDKDGKLKPVDKL